MISPIKIKNLKEVIPKSFGLIYVNGLLITVYIHSIDKNKIYIEASSKVSTIDKKELFFPYHISKQGTETPLEINKNGLDRLIGFINKHESLEAHEKYRHHLENISYLRTFKHVELTGGKAKLIHNIESNKLQIGYLMRRACGISEGDHTKAANIFIEDLRKFGLTLTTI